MIRKILFIGPVNLGKQPLGGDQFKNNLVINSLTDIYSVKVFDTYKMYQKPWKYFFLFYSIFLKNHDRLIISASTLSALRLLNIISLSNEKYRKTVYWVVGGILPDIVTGNDKLVACLNGIRKIGVQTNNLCIKLNKLGLTNVCRTPNFKNFNIDLLKNRSSMHINKTHELLRIVFISRISILKGVDKILDLMLQKNKLESLGKVIIDFYGPVDDSYKEIFFEFIEKNDCLNYKGYLDFREDIDGKYDMLNENYDLFLFPTRWPSEGFPGVLIDAMCSGLAIIATDWNYNNELIFEGKNGKLLQNANPEELISAIQYYQLNQQELFNQRKNSLLMAQTFHLKNNFHNYIDSLK